MLPQIGISLVRTFQDFPIVDIRFVIMLHFRSDIPSIYTRKFTVGCMYSKPDCNNSMRSPASICSMSPSNVIRMLLLSHLFIHPVRCQKWLVTPLHRQRVENRIYELSHSLLREVQPGIMSIVQQPHAPMAARLEGVLTFLDEIFAYIRTHMKSYLDVFRDYPMDNSVWGQIWNDVYVPEKVSNIIEKFPIRYDQRITVVFDTFLRILPSLQQTMSDRFHRQMSRGQQENFMVVWMTTLKMIEHCIQPDITLTTVQHDAIVEMHYQSFTPVDTRAVSLYSWAHPDDQHNRNTRIRMAVNGIIHHLVSTTTSVHNLSQIQSNVSACGQLYRERSTLYTVSPFYMFQMVVGQLGLIVMMVSIRIIMDKSTQL